MLRTASVAVALTLLLSACGAATNSTNGQFKGEQQEVVKVVDALATAGSRGDADKICKDILAKQLVTELKSAGGDCVSEMDRAISDASDYDLQVTSVKVNGSNATAQVRQGKDGEESTFTFVKEGGVWESVRPRRLTGIAARPTAVVATATTWAEFPQLWRELLDEVREHAQGRNVMLYLDDVPHVEVGVLPRGDFTPGGRVIASQLPGGAVVAVTHRGPYEDLGVAHAAAQRYCALHGLERAGPRWEIYGPWHEDPAQRETEVVYLIR